MVSAWRRVGAVASAMTSTNSLVAIWLFEALNYSVHAVLRPEPWGFASQLAGYSLWFVQLSCFAACQAVLPGAPPHDWERLAHAGGEEAVVCKRSGRLLPPRALYVRRAGGVVLGLDHFCVWMGTPIGFRNRKLFILFILYSFVFCVMGSAHSIYEVLFLAPPRLAVPLFFDAAPLPRRVGFWHAPMALAGWVCDVGRWVLLLLESAYAQGTLTYHVALLLTAVLNPAAAIFLGCGTANQLLLVMFNRTTLAPMDRTYDVGVFRNIQQVFGANPLLWPLPISCPVGDGIHFPLNPRVAANPGKRRVVRSPIPSDGSEATGREQKGGRLMRCVRSAILLWENWFFCGMVGVGALRYSVRVFLLYRSKFGRPFVPSTPPPPPTKRKPAKEARRFTFYPGPPEEDEVEEHDD
ncbi:hypothetical protein AB1Y20_014818 [Prymnesium parvum]|uniref:Palmitoyltransferase n=1 Tax=Prymnesium parvum TaxID=97485 RepID=A0AB34K0P5_PRYPA